MDKYQSLFNNRGSRPKQVLIMGLKGAGKKEILKKFQLGKVDFKEVKGKALSIFNSNTWFKFEVPDFVAEAFIYTQTKIKRTCVV